jgi:hypothetical protein
MRIARVKTFVANVSCNVIGVANSSVVMNERQLL